MLFVNFVLVTGRKGKGYKEIYRFSGGVAMGRAENG
jgi:hypothetical protein